MGVHARLRAAGRARGAGRGGRGGPCLTGLIFKREIRYCHIIWVFSLRKIGETFEVKISHKPPIPTLGVNVPRSSVQT